MDNDDGWSVVTKGSKKDNSAALKKAQNAINREKVEGIRSHFFTDEKDLFGKIQSSQIYPKTKELIFSFLESKPLKDQEVSFSIRSIGVGSMIGSLYAYIQTSLIYLLQKDLQDFFSVHQVKLSEFFSGINDPIFTEKDLEYIKEHEMTRIENDSDLWTTKKGELSVFYMPHCEKEIYARVLELNKENLENIIVIGNSFKKYVDHLELVGKTFAGFEIMKSAIEDSRYKEEALPGFEPCYEAFNNTSFITFIKK